MARGTVKLRSAGESRNAAQSVTLLEAIEEFGFDVVFRREASVADRQPVAARSPGADAPGSIPMEPGASLRSAADASAPGLRSSPSAAGLTQLLRDAATLGVRGAVDDHSVAFAGRALLQATRQSSNFRMHAWSAFR